MDPALVETPDYVAIIRRRKWQFVLPAVVLFVVAVLAALLWPPTYQSSATILIEEPDVPRDLVSSTITSFADQRLQVITQRVMTTQNLIRIIDKFGLYAAERRRSPVNLLVENMRESINLDLVSADVVDPRSGRPTQATIAFTLSFEDRLPNKAQSVLSELVSLYLSENLRTRREKAAETTEFLESEVTKLQAEVDKLEADLADFKRKHAGSLPEQMAINAQLMDRTERDLIEVKRQVQTLEERKIYLQSELAQLNPYDSYLVDGQKVLSPGQRLKALETEYIVLKGKYGPRHPDVVSLSRALAALRAETGGGSSIGELRTKRGAIKTELGLARKKYAAGHPDVVRLQRQLETVQAALAKAEKAPRRAAKTVKPDNPAYIQLQAQLAAVKSDLKSRATQLATLDAKLTNFEKRALAAPQIEREYLLLQRGYENALVSYKEVKAKLGAAKLGQALETERKSEKFSLIEPPDLPLKPVKPNRLAILVLGFVFSIGAGVGFVALFERLDQAVYGSKQLAALAGVPPLVVIPFIQNRADILRSRRMVGVTAVGTVVTAVLALYLVSTYLIPLDVLWSIAERRFGDLLARLGDA